MQVILMKDVKPRGKKDDIIEVAPGFALNFLFPNKLAVLATPQNVKALKARQAEDKAAHDRVLKLASEIANKIRDLKVTMYLNGTSQIKVYGSITSGDISDILRDKYDIEVSKKKIILDQPIKALGSYKIPIKLFETVQANLNLTVELNKIND